jgi:hypothetical protein
LADAEHDVVADAARMREFLASLFGGHAEAD